MSIHKSGRRPNPQISYDTRKHPNGIPGHDAPTIRQPDNSRIAYDTRKHPNGIPNAADGFERGSVPSPADVAIGQVGGSIAEGGSLFSLQMSEAGGCKLDMTVDEKDMVSFFDSDFSVPDASTLAEAWGMNVGDAKGYIGAKVRNGDSKMMRNELEAIERTNRLEVLGAMTGAGKAKLTQDQEDMISFFDSDFSVSDASMLADAWGMDVGDAKGYIGAKVLNNDSKMMRSELEAIERTNGLEVLGGMTGADKGKLIQDQEDMISFFDSDFSVSDASVLAEAWGVSVGDAKGHIGAKVLNGGSKVMRNELEAIERTNRLEVLGAMTGADKSKLTQEQEDMISFFDSDFTVPDASMLADAWGMDVGDAKGYIGAKVLNNDSKMMRNELEAIGRTNRLEILGGMTGADKTNSIEDQNFMNSFFDSDFTVSDASMLAEAWGMSVGDAKSFIGEKVFRGDAKIMRNNLEAME